MAARIAAMVVAASAALVWLAAKGWAVAGFPPIMMRHQVGATLVLDGLVLWGIFDRRPPVFGVLVSRGRPHSPAVAVTFDDGPTEPYTSQILDVLRKYDARATFFVLGLRAQAHPEVLRRAVAEGHEVANHGWDHAPLPLRSPAYIRHTIARTSALIAQITGRRPCLFRAPYGWRNPWVNPAARLEGCEPVAWSFGVYDTDRPGADTIARRSIAGLESGAILLLHDGRSLDPSPDASQVVEALPAILEAARTRGLRLLTLSALLADAALER
ncbi:MAG: polysaccharide deacetylase family protein [Acidobacteria bacterium]|nr:polysaccharide deacetylase family protein [Acidobacteriota bacterium]